MNSKQQVQIVKSRIKVDGKRRLDLRDTPSLKKSDLELLSKNNNQHEQIRFVTMVDGKEVDYTEPRHRSKEEFYPYGDIQFLRRRNEIKELLKKDHEDVYGVSVSGKEIRFCDVYNYDKKFDIIQLSHKSYFNNCVKEDYVQEHPSESCKTQAIISNYMEKKYDFGYTCYDDYLDYRFNFTNLVYSPQNMESPFITCGVDGCIFQCGDETELNKHRELHDNPLAFPCLNKQCKHSCKSRFDLKQHMLQHCKTVFPCLKPHCRFIDFVPMKDSIHFISHNYDHFSIPVGRKLRGLCYICKKMYRNICSHETLHPEYRFYCRYPNCTKSYSQMNEFYIHRSLHFLHDLMKKKKKLIVCFINYFTINVYYLYYKFVSYIKMIYIE